MNSNVTSKTAALIERGVQLMQAAQYLEAARAFERAAQQSPTLADAHAMRADALMRAGKSEGALASVERALRLRPRWLEAMVLRGNIEAVLGRHKDAERTFQQAIDNFGPTAELYTNLGHARRQQERWSDALEAYDRALSIQPDAAYLHVCKGDMLLVLRRLGEAEQSLRRGIDLNPALHDAEQSLATTLLLLRKFDELEAVCRLILQADPTSSEAIRHLIEALAAQGRLAEGEGAILGAIERAPADIGIGTWHAHWLWRSGKRDEAIEAYNYAASLGGSDRNPKLVELKCELASALLSIGRWEDGWKEYQWFYDREEMKQRYPDLVAEPQYVRTAVKSLSIRLRSEQGIGDELFFLRFAPWLRNRGHRLTLATHSKSVALLRPMTHLIDRVENVAVDDPVPCDMELLCSDLPLATTSTPPAPLTLKPDPPRVRRLVERLSEFGPAPYIGVTWRGGLMPDEQREAKRDRVYSKQVPLAELATVLRPIHGTIVVLQRLIANDELDAFVAALGREVLDLSAVHDDLQESLALLSLLDEYIGVSNTNMHMLAGIEGKRARVLVQTPAEWRWGLEGDSSPWFPGFHLYRQHRDKSWDTAFAQLAEDIRGSYASS